MENISPDDQQERNDPILLPVSEDPKTATRFSDPILHRRKTFRSLECPPKFKARQDTERPNPKKALLKHPSIEIRPFYRPTAEKLSKRLKTSKKGETSELLLLEN